LMHVIAAKAVCFHEALNPEFKSYQLQVIKNASRLAEAMKELGYHIVSGGTDTHLLLVNVKKSLGITWKVAETVLDKVAITCNKNTVPYDDEKPLLTSGIRLGTAGVTTRCFREEEMELVAKLIDKALRNRDDDTVLESIREEALSLSRRFPLYQD